MLVENAIQRSDVGQGGMHGPDEEASDEMPVMPVDHIGQQSVEIGTFLEDVGNAGDKKCAVAGGIKKKRGVRGRIIRGSRGKKRAERRGSQVEVSPKTVSTVGTRMRLSHA